MKRDYNIGDSEYEKYQANKTTNLLIILVITLILGLLCIEKFLL